MHLFFVTTKAPWPPQDGGRLLRNTGAAGAAWVGVVAPPGSVVEATTGDGRTLRRTARTDGSYLSARDPRVVVGLDTESAPSSLRIRWPGRGELRLEGPPTGRYFVIPQAGRAGPG